MNGHRPTYPCGASEEFYGPFLIRPIIWLHQRYVLWACEKHINSAAFGSDDYDQLESQEAFIPGFVVKRFLPRPNDIRAKEGSLLKDILKPFQRPSNALVTPFNAI